VEKTLRLESADALPHLFPPPDETSAANPPCRNRCGQFWYRHNLDAAPLIVTPEPLERSASKVFEPVCKQDLEGIVCKPRTSPYAELVGQSEEPINIPRLKAGTKLFETLFRSAARCSLEPVS